MKNKRHKCILSIINSNIVQTQEELVEGLKQAGFDCTQGTISRDIRELRLVKVLDESGVYKYAQPKEGGSYLERLKEVFAQSVLSVVPAGKGDLRLSFLFKEAVIAAQFFFCHRFQRVAQGHLSAGDGQFHGDTVLSLRITKKELRALSVYIIAQLNKKRKRFLKI